MSNAQIVPVMAQTSQVSKAGLFGNFGSMGMILLALIGCALMYVMYKFRKLESDYQESKSNQYTDNDAERVVQRILKDNATCKLLRDRIYEMDEQEFLAEEAENNNQTCPIRIPENNQQNNIGMMDMAASIFGMQLPRMPGMHMPRQDQGHQMPTIVEVPEGQDHQDRQDGHAVPELPSNGGKTVRWEDIDDNNGNNDNNDSNDSDDNGDPIN